MDHTDIRGLRVDYRIASVRRGAGTCHVHHPQVVRFTHSTNPRPHAAYESRRRAADFGQLRVYIQPDLPMAGHDV